MSWRISSLNPWNWWPGSGGDTAHKTEINLEELAGDIDDVLIGLFRSIDSMHSTTLNHMFQLKQFNENIAEENRGPASGIKYSVKCLKDAESSLWHNRNMVLKVFERIKEESQNTKSSIRDQMSQTFNYLEEDDIPEDYSGINDNDESTQQSQKTENLQQPQIIENLEKRVSDLEKQINEPKQEFTIVSSDINVQMYHSKDSTVVTDVIEQLQKQLIQSEKLLKFTPCAKPESAQPDVPLLIMCLNSSRLGTDALRAIKGISDSKRTALIVVQYKEAHALSSSLSKQILSETEFKTLGGIFDIAYTKDQGLYACEMNTQAITDIISFIKQF
ncbi:hypothetical protein ACF0H5_002353 [Mactra antiquata]